MGEYKLLVLILMNCRPTMLNLKVYYLLYLDLDDLHKLSHLTYYICII